MSESQIVSCVTCNAEIPLSDADVVGMGYRCTKCSTQTHVNALSSGRSDVGDHLTDDERAENMRSFRLKAIGGACTLAISLVMLGTGMIKLGVGLFLAGASGLAYGITGYRHNRGNDQRSTNRIS